MSTGKARSTIPSSKKDDPSQPESQTDESTASSTGEQENQGRHSQRRFPPMSPEEFAKITGGPTLFISFGRGQRRTKGPEREAQQQRE